MKRRELLHATAAFGLIAATRSTASAAPPAPLKPPVSGGIPVAFLVSDGAVIIDFCGPWEVFQDVQVGEERGPHHVGLHRRSRAREQRSALGEVS